MKFYLRQSGDEKYSGVVEIDTLKELKCFFVSGKKPNISREFRIAFAEGWNDSTGWLTIHEESLLVIGKGD